MGDGGAVGLGVTWILVPIMAKTLCDLKKLLKTDFEAYQQHVRHAAHVCQKCGRVADDKQRLCKAQRLTS